MTVAHSIGESDAHPASIQEPGNAETVMAVTRRAACSLVGGLSAAALLGISPARAFAAGRHDIRYVITDRRFAQSLEFGAVLARQGSERLEVTDGLTRLWQASLVPLWRQKQGAIAGLTLRGTWDCIAEQARSCGRRSVFVGHHHAFAEEGRPTDHMLRAPLPVLGDASLLEKCGEAWPRVMAQLAMQCPTDRHPSSDRRFRQPSSTAAPSLPLVSWIMA